MVLWSWAGGAAAVVLQAAACKSTACGGRHVRHANRTRQGRERAKRPAGRNVASATSSGRVASCTRSRRRLRAGGRAERGLFASVQCGAQAPASSATRAPQLRQLRSTPPALVSPALWVCNQAMRATGAAPGTLHGASNTIFSQLAPQNASPAEPSCCTLCKGAIHDRGRRRGAAHGRGWLCSSASSVLSEAVGLQKKGLQSLIWLPGGGGDPRPGGGGAASASAAGALGGISQHMSRLISACAVHIATVLARGATPCVAGSRMPLAERAACLQPRLRPCARSMLVNPYV